MTSAPKPKPPEKQGPTKKDEKQEFVRKPHLTDRPFRDDRLVALKADLDKQVSKNNHPTNSKRR